LTIFWSIAAFVACTAKLLIRRRRAPHTEAQLQSPEPRLLSTYDGAGEIEVVQELDGSFSRMLFRWRGCELDGAAATDVHRWFSPHGCACDCTKEDGALAGYVLGGAFALKDENTVLVFERRLA